MQARAAPCARPLQQRPAAAAQSVCSRAGAARTAAPGAHHSAEARCNHLKRPARRAAACFSARRSRMALTPALYGQACNRQNACCVPLYDTLGEAAVLHALNHSDVRPRPLPRPRQRHRLCCRSGDRRVAICADRLALYDTGEAGKRAPPSNALAVVTSLRHHPRDPGVGCAGSCHKLSIHCTEFGPWRLLRHEVLAVLKPVPAARPLTPRRAPGLRDLRVHREAAGAGQAAGGAARARAHGRRLGPWRRGGGLCARPCVAARPCQRLLLTLCPSCQALRKQPAQQQEPAGLQFWIGSRVDLRVPACQQTSFPIRSHLTTCGVCVMRSLREVRGRRIGELCPGSGLGRARRVLRGAARRRWRRWA